MTQGNTSFGISSPCKHEVIASVHDWWCLPLCACAICHKKASIKLGSGKSNISVTDPHLNQLMHTCVQMCSNA